MDAKTKTMAKKERAERKVCYFCILWLLLSWLYGYFWCSLVVSVFLRRCFLSKVVPELLVIPFKNFLFRSPLRSPGQARTRSIPMAMSSSSLRLRREVESRVESKTPTSREKNLVEKVRFQTKYIGFSSKGCSAILSR